MSLTTEDLLKIEKLLDFKLDQKLDQKFDEKLNPIKKDIGILKDQVSTILVRLDREELPFIVKKIDDVDSQTKDNTKRIETLELKVFKENG